MFTGIIEDIGRVVHISIEGTNYHFSIETSLAQEAHIDQSISHNGVCLTIVSKSENQYTVTAIKETLDITNLKTWKVGTKVNLERAMLPSQRLDGHFVQGHVDTITSCSEIIEVDGSWYYTFDLPSQYRSLIVHKGSITINGTSLTVIAPEDLDTSFKVAIIPYTYEHTNFHQLEVGSLVNIEFDILGKYIAKHLALQNKKHNHG